MTTDASPAIEHRSRPAAVTAVVVLAVLQAVLLVAIGALLVARRGDAAVAADLEIDTSGVLPAGITLIVLGALPAVVALGLARGSELARSVTAAVMTLQLAPSVFAFVALQDLRPAGVTTLVVPVAVLWLLYGSDRSQGFFGR